MKLKSFGALLVVLGLASFSISAQEARVTISKGEASRCAIIPTVAPKYEGRNVYHYAKDKNGKRHISKDLGQRGKGLSFFKLKPSQKQSMTAQLMMPSGKYFTYWYMVDNRGKLSGPSPYDFEIEPLSKTEFANREKRFVDIELEQDLPCSCFRYADKPRRCAGGNINVIINNARDKAPRVGEKVGEFGHKAYESIKRGAGHVKKGWNNYKK